MRLLFFLFTLIPLSVQSQDIFNGTFDRSFYLPGFDGEVLTSVTFDGELYIGGNFTSYNDQLLPGIAKWNGSNWAKISDADHSNSIEGGVNSLFVYDGKLVVGGYYEYEGTSRFSNIGYWDGENWHAMGDGLNGQVRKLIEFQGELIALGSFQKSGVRSVGGIGKWNGQDWTPLDFRFPSGASIYSASVTDSKLLISGSFDQLGTYSSIRDDMFVGEYKFTQIDTAFYRGEGSKWWIWGNGNQTFTSTLYEHSFNSSGVKYGDRWVQMCSPFTSCDVQWITFSDSLGGKNQNVTIDTKIINYCDGRENTFGPSISKLGSFNSEDDSEFILSIREENYNCNQDADYEIRFKAEKISNGSKAKASVPYNVENIILWNGSSFSDLKPLPSKTRVHSVIHNGKVYAANSEFIGDNLVSKVYTWSGNDWINIGGVFEGYIQSIKSINNKLFVYGNFTTIDGVPVYGIAEWVNGSWVQIGDQNYPIDVEMVSEFDEQLMITGRIVDGADIIQTGLINAQNHLVIYDNPNGGLGSIGRYTYAYQYDETMYFYGVFGQIGSYQYNNFAFYNPGESISSFTDGLGDFRYFFSDYVSAFSLLDEKVIIAGLWDNNESIDKIAVWEDEWVQLGQDVYAGIIIEFAEFQDTLFAIGDFRIDKSEESGYINWIYDIAKFDGEKWGEVSIPYEGFGAIFDVLVRNDELFISGKMNSEPIVARWDGSEWFSYPTDDLPFASSFDNIAFHNGELYASLSFESPNGIGLNSRIMKYEDDSWVQIGNDFEGLIWFILDHEGHLVVSGEFGIVGNTETGPITIWDGEEWIGLPSIVRITKDLYGRVYQLQSIDQGILFSGVFRYVDDIPTRNVGIYITDGSKNYMSENGMNKGFNLSQNYPNPFNPTTNINFTLPVSSVIKVDIYDMLGRNIQTITNQRYSAGTHTIKFDAGSLASGIYIYQLNVEGVIETRRMTLIK